MPNATRQPAPGHASQAKLVSTTNASACCALSHQSNTGYCSCSTGNSANTVPSTMAKHQPNLNINGRFSTRILQPHEQQSSPKAALLCWPEPRSSRLALLHPHPVHHLALGLVTRHHGLNQLADLGHVVGVHRTHQRLQLRL